MKTLTFLVTVPEKGVNGVPLDPRAVASYIQEAVECWSGQFNPDESSLFYWANGKTKVQFVGRK